MNIRLASFVGKLPCTLAVIAALSACASSYKVEGASTVASLDGSKLYLKAMKGGEMSNIDSCDVVHGEFHFYGSLDTVRMATLYMDGEGLLPIVLERGDIFVKIDNAGQTVSGSPLNDLLYDFLDRHKQLANQMGELTHKQSQMLLEGIDEATINQTLSAEAAAIAQEEDRLVTTFIIDNCDNVLGPAVFMMITNSFRYPILTPQIEHIMSQASDKFKSDAYVREYYRTASENEARMQGLDPTAPQQPQPADTASTESGMQQ